MSVDTQSVSGRREVYFNTLEELLADAEQLASGEIICLGNWSAGQVLSHIAKAMQMSVDGTEFRAPWFVRMGVRLIRNRIIHGPMRAGFKLPPDAEAVLIPGTTSTEEGMTALRAAIHRLEHEPPRAIHPLLGPLSPEQWIRLHLTHASLHMSFLRPAAS